MLDLTDALLRLVSATTWDGASGLVTALSEVIRMATPFDAGEVAVAQPVEFRRWSLTDDDEDVVESDLLLHVGVCARPVRVDDLPEVADFPRTLSRLRGRGLQSLLLFPLASPGGPEGAIVLARSFGWAFAGAPLAYLWPVARMGGLCLERALALTALRRKLEFMGDGERDSRGIEDRLRRDADAVRRELADARSSMAATRADLETAEGRVHALEAELGRARADLAEARETIERPAASAREAPAPPPGPDPPARGRRRSSRSSHS